MRNSSRVRRAFTLIELLVVVLIIGILASVAVPQYFSVVEKGRLSEAFSCVQAVLGAEERYLARNPAGYANEGDLTAPANLDVNCASLRYFTNASVSNAAAATYTVSLTRNGVSFNTISGAAAGYTITYTKNANPSWGGTIPPGWLPTSS